MEVDKWPRLAARLRELVGRGGLGGDLPVPIPVGGGGGGGVVGLAGGGRGGRLRVRRLGAAAEAAALMARLRAGARADS